MNQYPNGGTPPSTFVEVPSHTTPSLPKTGTDLAPIFDFGLAGLLGGAAIIIVAKARLHRPWSARKNP